MDAHSELMPAYPWGGTTPNAGQANLPDTGAYADGVLSSGQARSPSRAANRLRRGGRLDRLKPVATRSAPTTAARRTRPWCARRRHAPARCDDSAFGKGTGGRLTTRCS